MPILPGPLDLLNAAVPLRGTDVSRGVEYGAHPRHVMDIYRPDDADTSRPVLVWFYGGAWQSGRRQDYRFVAATLARRGLVVAVPDYRLHPEVRYPDFLHDAAAAVAMLQRRAVEWGGDGGRIILAGHSAGAYIAVMLALDRRWLGAREGIAGAVGLGGPYDFLPILGADIRAVFAGPQDPRQTQPISHAGGGGPPLLLLHGARDRTCYPRNSLALASRVAAAGGTARVVLYPGIGHVGILLSLVPWLARCPVLADMERFVGGLLAPAEGRAIQPTA
jgi:acetyl esterase/lipase